MTRPRPTSAAAPSGDASHARATSLDVERLREVVRARRDEFHGAAPFPHLVVDDLLHPAVADALLDEFARTDGEWIAYRHVTERKRGFNDLERMGPTTRAVVADLNGPEVVAILAHLTGVADLRADAALDGGGLQEMPPGGFLDVHADFLSHPTRRTWSRQVNLLLFLNKDWDAAYGGALELWDADARMPVREIAPLFNRCVIFRPGATSFHGVPTPLTCPPDRSRKSLALYYFREEAQPCALRPTRYLARPNDSYARRALVQLDRLMLYAYAVLKRYTPFGDRLATKILSRL